MGLIFGNFDIGDGGDCHYKSNIKPCQSSESKSLFTSQQQQQQPSRQHKSLVLTSANRQFLTSLGYNVIVSNLSAVSKTKIR